MKLREWDYTHGGSGGFVEVEYPDEVIQDFVNWFRTKRQWRERDATELVFLHWMRFERHLTDARNAQALIDAVAEPESCTAETKAGNPCKNMVGVENGLCHIHRRTLVPA